MSSAVDSPTHVTVLKPALRGWSHVVAFAAFVVLGAATIAVSTSTPRGPLLIIIYVVGTGAMFGVSAAYHRLRWQPPARALMSRLDHSTIFLAIAGAYTPIAVAASNDWHRWSVLLTVWVGSAAGIALQWVPHGLPRWVFATVYVVVGWAALPSVSVWYSGLGPLVFSFIIGGGVAYTLGAVIYAVKRPDPWPRVFGFHEIFHLCTIVGAGLHYAAITVLVHRSR